jgi:catechol 2,3-dioxygenase-like lactoylglutathione lyase family enzyme
MILGIDHVVILVNDLQQTITDYTDLGFTVVPGGEQADGRSHNALIAFEDGSYLELIAFKNGTVPEDHFFHRPGDPEGIVTYALLPDNIDSTVEEARSRGLEMAGPRPGGRERPDGTRIEWKIAAPLSHDMPFLCADVTPRELRVPGGDALTHANGAAGIADLWIKVDDLEASTARYTALLGTGPSRTTASGGDSVTYIVGNTNVTLSAVSGATNSGEEGPWNIAIQGKPPLATSVHDLDRTHGVHINFALSPVQVNSVADEYNYVAALPCRVCDSPGGTFTVQRQMLLNEPGEPTLDYLNIACGRCGTVGPVVFDISSFFGK